MPEKDEVRGCWKKLHFTEQACYWEDQISEEKMGETCSAHGKHEGGKNLVEKPEGKRQLERPRRRWMSGVRVVNGFIWLRIRTDGGLLWTI